MKSDQTTSANGLTTVSSDGVGLAAAPQGLEAECRRQAIVIARLSEALSTIERGVRALKAENADLRAENDRLHRHRRVESRSDRRMDGGEPAEVTIPLGVGAPAVARRVVADRLAGLVAPCVLETALLLVSELVTNSVRHSGVPEGEDVVVRVDLWRDGCRLEVEDPGRDGVIAPQPQDRHNGSGMGLNLVQILSDHWGVVRAAGGPTRVWAQLPRAAAPGTSPVAQGEETDPCRD